MYIGKQQDRASSPAMNSTPTGQLQRKPVGRWCFSRKIIY